MVRLGLGLVLGLVSGHSKGWFEAMWLVSRGTGLASDHRRVRGWFRDRGTGLNSGHEVGFRPYQGYRVG